MSSLNVEKEYLTELIRDFPVAGETVDPVEALQDIATTYRGLEGVVEGLAKSIGNQSLPKFFNNINTLAHEFLFNGILSNAGQFRKVTDRNRGKVYFGGEQIRQPSGSKFSGISADLIDSEIVKAFDLLKANDPDPVRTSILFYQRYVYIHPFYDANGRIARLLVTIYLRFHGYYIRWANLEKTKKNKFLGKLNECHKRMNKPGFDEYFDYLYKFWKEFVIPISDLNQ